MEPLCISSKESREGCCPSSGTRQQERREIEAIEGEPCRDPEELSAKADPLVAEKKSLGESGRPQVAPAPSDTCAVQELPTEKNEEGEVQQESKGEDQGEGYVSEMEDRPSTGECAAGFSVPAAPLVDMLYSHAPSSKP